MFPSPLRLLFLWVLWDMIANFVEWDHQLQVDIFMQKMWQFIDWCFFTIMTQIFFLRFSLRFITIIALLLDLDCLDFRARVMLLRLLLILLVKGDFWVCCDWEVDFKLFEELGSLGTVLCFLFLSLVTGFELWHRLHFRILLKKWGRS